MFYIYKENIFKKDFCDILIEKSEQIGYSQSTINVYGDQKTNLSIRNNDRLEFYDNDVIKQIETKIFNEFDELQHFNKDLKLDSLNDHLKFYRYNSGQYFKPHRDGTIKLENKQSYVTILIYLNSCSSGATVLMPNGPRYQQDFISFLPKIGSVLCFQHDVFHEGKIINGESKYVLRSDIFYKTMI